MVYISRRSFVVGVAASIAVTSLCGAAPSVLADVGTPPADMNGNPVFWPNTNLKSGITVEHFRVVPGHSGTGVVIFGAVFNTNALALSSPSSCTLVVRASDGKALDGADADFDYPILPGHRRIGFQCFIPNTSITDVDPAKTAFANVSVQGDTKVKSMKKWPVGVVDWTIIDSENLDLQIDAHIQNRGEAPIEHGVNGRFTVWDENNLYCGYADGSVYGTLAPGETVEVLTHTTSGSVGYVNPMQYVGSTFHVIPRFSVLGVG